MPIRPFRFARRLEPILAAAPLLLAGCAGVPVLTPYYDLSYNPPEYRGEMPVVVRGAPFARPEEEIRQAIVAALRGTAQGVHFVAAPAGPVPVYRLVIMFSPPAGVGSTALCHQPQPPDATFGAAPAARVPVVAALCRAERDMTSAEGSIGTGDGPGSEAFRAGVSQLGIILLPPYNPGDRGGIDFPE